jgi:uncharacterized repeat protein (TIGR01451 family)
MTHFSFFSPALAHRSPVRRPPRARRLVALAVVAAMGPLALPARSESTQGCTEDRAQHLQDAKDDVLALVGEDLRTLENEAELARLAAIGYGVYPHQQVSLEGMGWPILDSLAPQDPTGGRPVSGRPTLLLYEPTPPAPPLTATEPRDGFDFPYHLAGWAYLFPYEFAQHPTVGGDSEPFLSCLERKDWFVHERGVHPFDDGGMEPLPPDEDYHGTAPGGPGTEPTPESPGDLSHGRAWDTHVWLDRADVEKVPIVSILNPGEPIPGVDPHVGTSPPVDPNNPPWFFSPRHAADLSLTVADSPDPVRRGERLTYTVTVMNQGPHRVGRVTLTGALPENTASRSAAASQGSCSLTQTALQCELGEMDPGASAPVTIVVRPTTQGLLTTTASVTANELDITETTDPQRGELWRDATADNTASATTTVLSRPATSAEEIP